MRGDFQGNFEYKQFELYMLSLVCNLHVRQRAIVFTEEELHGIHMYAQIENQQFWFTSIT